MKEFDFENEMTEQIDLENTEMNKEALGYSSEHYKYEYERALASGNMRAAENAKKNWAKAKASEALGEGEAAETGEEAKDSKASKEGEEALGYSSEHYKYEYERALASGNMRAAENAKKNWAKAKASEALGEGETAEAGKEALGYSSPNDINGRYHRDYNRGYINHYPRYTTYAKDVESLGAGEAAEDSKEGQDGEVSKEDKEALGYSSEYYKNEYASAISSGNKIAADNALKHFKEAKAREAAKK